MNDSLYVFPLPDPPDEDAPDEDPPDADPPELPDEQPAASAIRMAAAPAVGATNDRFIPAPSYVKTWAGCRCPMTPGAGLWGCCVSPSGSCGPGLFSGWQSPGNMFARSCIYMSSVSRLESETPNSAFLPPGEEQLLFLARS